MKCILPTICLLSLSFLSGCSTAPVERAETVVPVAADAAQSPEESCRLAVATTANRPVGDTSVLSVETSRAGAGVKIALKGAKRPWSCIVDAKGLVSNVMYMGEG